MALIKCPECGKENISDSAPTCPACGFAVREHFENIENTRTLKELELSEKSAAIEKYKLEKEHSIKEEKRLEGKRRLAEEAAIKRKNNFRKRSVAIAITLAVFAGLVLYFSELASRATYISEADMKSALQGVWVYRLEGTGDAMWAVVIEGEQLTRHYYSDDVAEPSDLEFNPSKGTISTSMHTYIVKKNDNSIYLREDGEEYHSGSLESLGRDPESSNYQDDMISANIAADAYCHTLQNKQPTISSAWTLDGGTSSGNFYYFDCSVKYTNGDLRIGTITVYKDGSGNFNAQGLEFKY